MKTAKEKGIKYLDDCYLDIEGINKNFRFQIDKALDIAIIERDKLWQKRFEWLENELLRCGISGLVGIKIKEAQNKEFTK